MEIRDKGLETINEEFKVSLTNIMNGFHGHIG